MANVVLGIAFYKGKQILDASISLYEAEGGKKLTKNFIGDLGGLKVCIPNNVASFVDYDGDPVFGEKRKSKPERTYSSKLRGFVMAVQFPNMRIRKKEEGNAPSLKVDDSWLNVSVTSGEHYPTLGVLAPKSHLEGRQVKYDFKWYHHVQMKDHYYGLEVYKPTGTNPENGMLADEYELVKDVYVQRNNDGLVDTYISCSRRGIRFCKMFFVLEPKAKISLNIRFGIGQLKNWQEIKSKSEELVLGFNDSCEMPAN